VSSYPIPPKKNGRPLKSDDDHFCYFVTTSTVSALQRPLPVFFTAKIIFIRVSKNYHYDKIR